MPVDLKEVCNRVRAIAYNVGEFILEERTKLTSGSIETKGKNDFVTNVDKGAEERIIKGLKELIPGAGFIAEENTDSTKGKVYNWIIDPIDGTTNFIHGFPCFCISIGLTRNEELVLGVIYELNLKECFYAWEGSPAYLNEKVIKVSQAAHLRDSLFATGFPYHDFGRMDEYMNLFQFLMKNTHGVRRPGSAAADLAYVACGRFEGFYEYGLKPWDVAAGSFIIQQAGGKVSDFTRGNNFLFGKELIASNGKVHEEFMRAVEEYFPSKK